MSEKEKRDFTETQKQKARNYRMARIARKKGCQIIVPFTKAEIIKRDGLNCYLCGRRLTEKEVVMEHILPPLSRRQSQTGKHRRFLWAL